MKGRLLVIVPGLGLLRYKEIKAQREKVTCPESHSMEKAVLTSVCLLGHCSFHWTTCPSLKILLRVLLILIRSCLTIEKCHFLVPWGTESPVIAGLGAASWWCRWHLLTSFHTRWSDTGECAQNRLLQEPVSTCDSSKLVVKTYHNLLYLVRYISTVIIIIITS